MSETATAKPVNERFIKVGKLTFPDVLTYGDSVKLKYNDTEYNLTVVKIDGLDNQDGTIDLVYTLKV